LSFRGQLGAVRELPERATRFGDPVGRVGDAAKSVVGERGPGQDERGRQRDEREVARGRLSLLHDGPDRR